MEKTSASTLTSCKPDVFNVTSSRDPCLIPAPPSPTPPSPWPACSPPAWWPSWGPAPASSSPPSPTASSSSTCSSSTPSTSSSPLSSWVWPPPYSGPLSGPSSPITPTWELSTGMPGSSGQFINHLSSSETILPTLWSDTTSTSIPHREEILAMDLPLSPCHPRSWCGSWGRRPGSPTGIVQWEKAWGTRCGCWPVITWASCPWPCSTRGCIRWSGTVCTQPVSDSPWTLERTGRLWRWLEACSLVSER